jgi:hypothetical protein
MIAVCIGSGTAQSQEIRDIRDPEQTSTQSHALKGTWLPGKLRNVDLSNGKEISDDTNKFEDVERGFVLVPNFDRLGSCGLVRPRAGQVGPLGATNRS